jgi:hypothetical protein
VEETPTCKALLYNDLYKFLVSPVHLGVLPQQQVYLVESVVPPRYLFLVYSKNHVQMKIFYTPFYLITYFSIIVLGLTYLLTLGIKIVLYYNRK